MLHLSNHQLELMANKRLHQFILKMINHFKHINAPYLPESSDEQYKLIFNKVKESSKWQLKTDLHIEKFLFLVVHYPYLQQAEYDHKILENLSWPDRDADDKLNELAMQLIVLSKKKEEAT